MINGVGDILAGGKFDEAFSMQGLSALANF